MRNFATRKATLPHKTFQTNTMDITLRNATPEDAASVARYVALALHRTLDDKTLRTLAEVCKADDVLYSYRNAILACLSADTTIAGKTYAQGTPVGLCLAYDGKDYHEMRLRTFSRLSEMVGTETAEMEDETESGEYYIDSLAVDANFRHQGFARRLIHAQMERGKSLSERLPTDAPGRIKAATLLVDPDNTGAQALYRDCGFAHQRDVYAFGQTFWKWKANF